MDSDAVAIRQFAHQIVQRQIGLCTHARFYPVLNGDQLAMTTIIAPSARLQPARLVPHDHQVVDELHRNTNPRGGGAVRVTFLHKSDDTLPQRHGMWPIHHETPIFAKMTGDHGSQLMGR